ncbi:hypothetical protein RchiOBHm_Chr1g0372201 [Rosa chinensis]|uniref:Uncharacterized protein n=1 Tax=Rosa chinensis TaxID=74649 RepID=A0A2P6SLT7_ROSCH|nr:hypothetical protein RchiOBHm_Chr1g0372201 [Rosa chinensis]
MDVGLSKILMSCLRCLLHLSTKSSWSSLRWFSQNTNGMIFILGMIIKGKLSTLDKVSVYFPHTINSCPSKLYWF